MPSNQRKLVYLITIISSILFSIYSAFAADIINSDGILYIQTADAFLTGGFSKAMTLFSWPFYPITFSYIHKITGVSLAASAYTLNTILLTIASVSFLRIYEEIQPINLPLWIPALISVAIPILNDYRVYIIRGHGFWAFILLALLFFVLYSKKPSIKLAILWQVSAIIGMLFRIEGAIFLACAPFYFLFSKNSRAEFLHHFLRLNLITIPTTILGLIIVFSYILKLEDLSHHLMFRLSYFLPTSLISGITGAASEVHKIMIHSSSYEALVVVTFGLLSLIAFKVIKNINIIYLGIWIFGNNKKWIKTTPENGIVLYFAIIAILPLISITGRYQFLSSRHTVLAVILFTIIISQYITYFAHSLFDKKRWLASTALISLIIILFLDGIIHTGAIKGNLITASTWALQNVKSNSKIACNDDRFVFYTNNQCVYEQDLDKNNIKETSLLINSGKYNHLLLWVDRKNKQMRSYLSSNKSLVLLNSFSNKKNDEAQIYRILTPADNQHSGK